MRKRTPAEKDILRHHLFRILITAIEVALIAVAILLFVTACNSVGMAEGHEEEYDVAYVICAKGDRVNIRRFPNTHGEADGFLEPGDVVYLDGKKKNGFMHCVGLGTEAGEGWVHKGYLVSDEPTLVNRTAVICGRGKVAARKNVGGKRTRWLKSGGEVVVYYWSDEWSVTNCGYVMSKFIELDGE